MRAMMLKSGLLAVAVMLGIPLGGRAAESYSIDPAHTSVTFKVEHLGLSWSHGRFNDIAGEFRVDAENPASSRFALTIKTESIDTANKKRDEHLASPDFFNAKQYPTITFKSKAVKAGSAANMLEVTGDLTMHGVTKSVMISVELTGKGEFPPGTQRAGVEASFTVKRSEFDMSKMIGPVGDEVRLIVALEGVKQ